MSYTEVMNDKRLAYLIAKEMKIQAELREPLKKTQRQLKREEQARLNRLSRAKVDKREEKS